ncbi:MAG: COG3014 family protein [bacterium]
MDRREKDKEIHRAPAFRIITGFSLLLCSFLLCGCAGGVNYRVLQGYLQSDNCTAATSYVEHKEKGYGPNRRLLFLLDAASVNMMCDNYERSNTYFHEADGLAENLWTKSISREAVSFLVNDYTIPYAGEDFERALINLFSAINYAVLGELDDALVECRRLDANLSLYNMKYENKNVYREDAFGRYLSGILYESQGYLDDAFIAYSKAFEAFGNYARDYGTPVPPILTEDLMRMGEATHRSSEAQSLIKGPADVPYLAYSEARRYGKFVFIHLNGKAPAKEEGRLFVPTEYGPITLAFPRFRVERPACGDTMLLLQSPDNPTEARPELVEDINSIAVKNLDDRKGRVMIKMIARAAAKQAAINAASKSVDDQNMRELSRFLLNIINAAVEKADTRSWRTLPGEILMTRLYVPEGEYRVSGVHCGEEKVLADAMKIREGETRFVLLKTLY